MNKQKELNAVYRHEMDVLDRSRMELKRPNASHAGLMAEYEKLLVEYEKLFKLAKKISAISDAQGLMLKRRETDIKSLLDHAKQGFLTFGDGLRVNRLFSKECVRIFGRGVAGLDVVELLFEAAPQDRERYRETLLEAFRADDWHGTGETLLSSLPAQTSIGDKTVVLEYKPIADETTDERLVLLIVTDVSEKLASEERIRYLSSYDALTSLYNRSYAEPLLDRPIPPEQLPASLLVIDLNGLKLANDVFGHRTGDRLLARGARLLQNALGERATLARWGGDEFVALLPRTGARECDELVNRIRADCAASDIAPVKLSMAVGGATLSRPGESWSLAFAAAEKAMYKNKLLENKQVRIEMMRNVTEAMLEKGVERADHLERLSEQASAFAVEVGLAPGSQEWLTLQSLVRLHDVGCLALPVDVLLKPGPLDAEEWELVKSHSEIGYRMASSIGEWALAEAILGMHERWDGGGYPYGLSQEQIPFASRLLAIADAYDVMTHEQTYKSAVSAEAALREIEAQAGRQFDPLLAEAWVAWKRGARA